MSTYTHIGLLVAVCACACKAAPEKAPVPTEAPASTTSGVKPQQPIPQAASAAAVSPAEKAPSPLPCKAGEWTELFSVDGNGWFSAIWADRPDDIFVAGKFKRTSVSKAATSVGYTPKYEFPIYHFDGSAWQKQPTQAVSVIFDIAGTSSRDVYAVGGYLTIQHFDGHTWTREQFDENAGPRQQLNKIQIFENGTIIASGAATFALKRADSVWERIHPEFQAPADLPPGLPSHVAEEACNHREDIWFCRYDARRRITVFHEGRWKSGTIPHDSTVLTHQDDTWYVGTWRGLKKRATLFGTDKWETVPGTEAVDWAGATLLSNKEAIAGDGKGNVYLLSKGRIFEYRFAHNGYVRFFALSDTIFALNRNDVLCMERSFNTDSDS